MAAYVPSEQRSRSLEYTESIRRSCCSPPPWSEWLSIISTLNPACLRKAAMPSGRRNGPEKRRRTVLEE
eukprot:2788512-Pleurochrysis_carterae.AAC.2